MAFTKVKIKPGVNRDTTNYANEGGYYESEKIRFLSGYPQKIGGWVRDVTVSINGICREMFNYVTSNSDNILWIGTTNHLYAEVGGNLQDLTPARATFTSPTTNNCFDTTNGSRIVNVNITGHGVNATGEYVTFSGVVGPIGGIPQAEFNAEFQVYALVDSDNFQIQVTTAATSTTTGGGAAITAVFPILAGNDIDLYGYGWSAGAWSRLGWGTGTLTPLVIDQRDWWYDHFDNDSVMNIRNGAPYYWSYESTFSVRAVPMSTAATAAGFVGADVPAQVMQLMVSQNDRHLCAFGATQFGSATFDPMLIRWASFNSPLNWTPSATTSAGFYRLSRGSKIVRAIPTRQEILVFTDSTIYSMQFIARTDDIFSFQELADHISIASPRSISVANNVAYWMGQDKFYMYSGRVETLPCTLRNLVFSNINYEQKNQIISGTNERWNEVWWFYPTGNSTVPDSYVIYNYAEQIWYHGTLTRTAWLDSSLRVYPQAINGQYLYEHENGVDADGAAMTSYIITSDFDIVDGDEFLLVKRMIPDINFAGSTAATPRVLLTVKPRNFPGSNYINANQPLVELSTTVPVEQYTEQIFIRARARQMGLKIYSDELGVMWQMGLPRLDGRKDGKR